MITKPKNLAQRDWAGGLIFGDPEYGLGMKELILKEFYA
jgi:hypothetical protein